jgi:O-antigen ligase
VAGVMMSVIGIGEHILGFELATLVKSKVRFDTDINQVRVSGPYAGPETYGLTVVLCLAATLYWAQLRGGLRWWIAGIAVALELTAIAFTFFRVAWISAVVVLFIAFALRPRQVGRAVGVSAGFALVIAIVIAQLSALPAFTTRVNNTENFSSRVGSWEQAIHIWRAYPLVGVGIERYNAVAATLPTVYVKWADSTPNPHNSYLAVLAEVGPIGLAALVYLTAAIAGLLHRLNRLRFSRPDTLLAACVAGAAVAYLLFALTLWIFPYDSSNEFFAILLGMAAARVDVVSVRGRRRLTRLQRGDSPRGSGAAIGGRQLAPACRRASTQ